MTPGGPGSRARSREIGYAEGMREMYVLLRQGEESWRQAELDEAEAGRLEVAAVMGKVGAWLGTYADYASSAWEVHADTAGTFARDVEHRDWLEAEYRHYPAGPLELPQREHSEHN